MTETARNDDPLHEEHLVVAAIDTVAEDVVTLSLERADGSALPGWRPGAHVDVALPTGIERQYSLCGQLQRAGTWTVAVLLEAESRGGSSYVHRELRPGAQLLVRGPRNHFPLVDADEYRFIAGGIGITPMLPMAREVAAAGRSWRMLYGGRRRASMAFVEQLEQLGGDLTVSPEETHGLLDLEPFVRDASSGTAIYCCGPEPLIQAVEAICAGWAEDRLHVERFRPAEGALDGAADAFDVVLERAGITVRVAADQTILEALEAAGLDPVSSCREGTCGTCETEVVEGLPDHRDSVLSDGEKASNDVMMICCSRSLSERLVLDL